MLFHDGCEVKCSEVEESLEGSWEFNYDNDGSEYSGKYVVEVVVKEYENELEI